MADREPTPAEILERAGRALCPGDSWQADLAKMMGMRRDSLRQIMHGRMRLRADHFLTVLTLLEQRQAEMHQAEAAVRQWLRQVRDLD
jgi:hypothetical protein